MPDYAVNILCTLAYRSCVSSFSFKLARKDRVINMEFVENSKKEWRQVNKKKGHRSIGIVEKAQETSLDTGMHTTVCLCHYCTEQWMYLGMQRYTHITGNNLIPISDPTLLLISYHRVR